jgi:hypothetical protein
LEIIDVSLNRGDARRHRLGRAAASRLKPRVTSRRRTIVLRNRNALVCPRHHLGLSPVRPPTGNHAQTDTPNNAFVN